MTQPFGYKGDERTCLWCGRGLKFTRVWEEPGPNLRAQVVAEFAALNDLGIRGSGPIKSRDLGWISGGTHYPRVYSGTVTVGPRGLEREQSAGKPGTCADHDDHFCSGQCAQEFGRRAGELGYRLEK